MARSRVIGWGFLALGLWSGGLVLSQMDALATLNAGTVARTAAFPLRMAQAQLMLCDRALSTPLAQVTPALQLARNATDCLTLSETALAARPTFGLAHYVRALGLVHTAKPGAAEALRTATRFAPAEAWLAERRMVAQIATPDLRSEPEFDRDLGLLLTTQTGAEMVARYYLLRRELRLPITTAANAASLADQQRLLNLLKKFGKT